MIVQMIDNSGTKASSNASSLYQFLKSLEPLSVKNSVSIRNSSIGLDQRLVNTLAPKVPRYASSTLSQTCKRKMASKNTTGVGPISLAKTQYRKRVKSQLGSPKVPDFCSVFKPSSAEETGEFGSRIDKILLKEPRTATCECSSDYVTAEFSQGFSLEELSKEYNKALLSKLKSRGCAASDLNLVRQTLLQNERTLADLERDFSNSKQLLNTLQATLVRIQSLCNIYF